MRENHADRNSAGDWEKRIHTLEEEIAQRAHVEEALRKREEEIRRFSEQLAKLHTLSMEFSQTDTLDALCRMAVERGRTDFDFDRLSVWLYGEESTQLLGVYGTDEEGRTRAEHERLWKIQDPGLLAFREEGNPVNVRHQGPHHDHQGRNVGQGWNIIAAVRDGKNLIGVLAADNLLRHEPLRDYQVEFLGLYASVIGHFCARKRAEEALRRSQEQLFEMQKLESLGRLAGGIAHDFNNLLTAIMGYTELAQSTLPEEAPEHSVLAHVQTAADRAANLTRQLLMYARRQMVDFTTIDINKIILGMDSLLRSTLGAQYELVTLLDEQACCVSSNASQLEQVLLNLVVNARDAMLGQGRILLETQCITLDEEYVSQHVGVRPGEYVMFSVSDNGVGMTPEVQERVFEPFFTTKEVGKGTGLGLATCYGIVKQSHGNILVYSELGRGTTFKVYLPRIQAPPEVAAVAPRHHPAAGTETILVVDDEPMVRDTTTRILKSHGYRVLEAGNGADALHIAGAFPETIHLLLTDMVMPLMGGEELAQRLVSTRPQLQVLFMSGYTQKAVLYEGTLPSEMALISKPFTSATLIQKIREVLNSTIHLP